MPVSRPAEGFDIAVIGTGIAGMSAAWLLSRAHRVTVYERAFRPGGHSNTISVPTRQGALPVDMGFIVYNEPAYPNLTALFAHLRVETRPSDMSFAVSMDAGAFEYAGSDLRGLLAQKRNLLRPRFWSMLADLWRFYRRAAAEVETLPPDASLADLLRAGGYGRAFVEDHLLPMAAAIWSAPVGRVGDQPAAGFIRFCANHGLLQLRDRPVWRTVAGGSAAYVERLTAEFRDRIRLGHPVRAIGRDMAGVTVRDAAGGVRRHDHVVIATHSDEALALLETPLPVEREILGALRYTPNDAVMHADPTLMPRRRQAWASWNYIGGARGAPPCVTYWMNRLQGLPTDRQVFVTLNPHRQPDPATVIHRESYAHPVFDTAALAAQRRLWSLQGLQRTWYCGAYFGAGFHEDGLQAGLAVAEELGGVRRPWVVAEASGRIHRSAHRMGAAA